MGKELTVKELIKFLQKFEDRDLLTKIRESQDDDALPAYRRDDKKVKELGTEEKSCQTCVDTHRCGAGVEPGTTYAYSRYPCGDSGENDGCQSCIDYSCPICE